VGTSALKAVLYALTGRVLSTATRRYDYETPQPGWAEANPAEWWAALLAALTELRAAGFDLGAIQAIGLTGQMHTAVLLDESGQPLAPTILWLDRRAAAETVELQQKLGLPPYLLNSSYTLPKLLWLARRQPQVLARTRTLLWPKDYLRFRLTGQLLTDVTEAGGAALLDLERESWAFERLALVNLNPEALPQLRAASADAGPLLPAVAAQLGLSPAARVIVGAGDVIALLGGAPPRFGRLTCSLGSSGMLSGLVREDHVINDARCRLYIYPLLPVRLLNGVLSTSGAALSWAWQTLYGAEKTLAHSLDVALATPPGADSLFFLPYLAGERCPYWSDSLRGGFYGLTLTHSRAHLLRAVLEGVAYSLRHLLDIATELGVPVQEIALAGGGAAAPGWPQIIADVCQRPVVLYAGQETVTRALFAYCLTALERGTAFDEALNRTFEAPQRLRPRLELTAIYDPIYHRYRLLADFVAERIY
jgi:xylulokinase